MDQKVLYRNPSTDQIEVKEFTDRAAYRRYVHDPKTGLIILKEFAADAALGNLRIADPVLTNISQGYQPQQQLIGDILFPSVRVDKETGRFPAWGKEMLIIPGNLKRGLGQPVQRMQNLTGWITLSLDEYAEGFNIENREINEWAGTGDQLLTGRQTMVDEQLRLVREQIQAVLATTVGSYATGNALSGAGKDWGGTGDCVKDMQQLVAIVRKQNSRTVDLVWFTPTAWYLFTNNPNTFNKIKYGGTPVDPAQLWIGGEAAVAKLLGVRQVVVANVSYTTGTQGGFNQAAGTTDWLWEATNGACAGCAITGLGWMVPSFGYTYERRNSPIVESWYDNSVKSMKYDTEHFFNSAVTKTDGGAMYYAIK